MQSISNNLFSKLSTTKNAIIKIIRPFKMLIKLYKLLTRSGEMHTFINADGNKCTPLKCFDIKL